MGRLFGAPWVVVWRAEGNVMIVLVCLGQNAVVAMTGHEEGSEYARRVFRCGEVISSVSGPDGGRDVGVEGHL